MLDRKLILGYILSKEYLKELHGDGFFDYAYSQALLYLSWPYSFHISALFTLSVTFLFKSFFAFDLRGISFFILMTAFFITAFLLAKHFKSKYPPATFENEVKGLADKDKKSLRRFSTLFFVLNLLLFLLIEMPLVVFL